MAGIRTTVITTYNWYYIILPYTGSVWPAAWTACNAVPPDFELENLTIGGHQFAAGHDFLMSTCLHCASTVDPH